ncbi:hypothetical protein ABIB25_004382 [Nakamurella sp. UYEF19]
MKLACALTSCIEYCRRIIKNYLPSKGWAFDGRSGAIPGYHQHQRHVTKDFTVYPVRTGVALTV